MMEQNTGNKHFRFRKNASHVIYILFYIIYILYRAVYVRRITTIYENKQ